MFSNYHISYISQDLEYSIAMSSHRSRRDANVGVTKSARHKHQIDNSHSILHDIPHIVDMENATTSEGSIRGVVLSMIEYSPPSQINWRYISQSTHKPISWCKEVPKHVRKWQSLDNPYALKHQNEHTGTTTTTTEDSHKNDGRHHRCPQDSQDRQT